jgi:hypothetical protein
MRSERLNGRRLTGTTPDPYMTPSDTGLVWQWARSSAGEHCLHTAGVTGSIPVAPTNFFKDLDDFHRLVEAALL